MGERRENIEGNVEGVEEDMKRGWGDGYGGDDRGG